jgi:predicted amidohydrolase YtcJ
MIEADLILTGADVWTGDAARRWARAVAIRGDRVLAVGDDEDVRAFKGPSTEVRTLEGRMIVPGFQDAHAHPAFAARNLLNVNLDDIHSKDEYLARIGSFARANPDLEWIVGGGWYNPVFASTGGPRKEDLDAVVPDRPVFLMNSDVHAAWVNSRTLAAAGLTDASPDPWDGYLVRDADGSLTGALQEGAAYEVLRTVVPAPSCELWMSCLRRAQSELHALGITAWQDAWVEPGLLEAYEALDAAGELTMRVVTALWWDRHRGMEQVEYLTEQRDRVAGDANLHAGTVKIMLDGCPESCTASMLEPYESDFGLAHDTGIQFVGAEALNEAVVRLDALGFQVHQHALGDRASRSALDAVELARAANGPNDLRHHIAHLQMPHPSDIPRLRRLGVVANMQPFWAAPDPAIQTLTTPRVGDRTQRLYPIASLKAQGAVLAFGSDWPVSTPNVLKQLEVAVTRQVPGDPDAGVLDPSERIDLHAALSASTRGSAYVNHDDEAGVLASGMRADLAVLDRNVFDRTLGAIGDAQVELTLAAGRVVFEA